MIIKIGLKANAEWIVKEMQDKYLASFYRPDDIQHKVVMELNHVQLMDLRDLLSKHDVDVMKSIHMCNPEKDGVDISIFIVKNEKV